MLDLASAFGLSTAAGLNAYIPMLTVAVLARFTHLIELQEPWSALTSWWIIALLAVLLVIEEIADKIPAVDTVNDVVQTLVRPAAGAILFAATTQSSINMHPVLAFGCGVILAGTVHVVKAGARPAVTAATAGMANPIVSTVEDVVSAVTSFVSVIFPYLVIVWVILLALTIRLVVRWRRRRRQERANVAA
ncbi:MAG: DUF4126 domain-containing protein [Anaerolineae bacterium]|nr:DUF4126 domain-containing protein [Anaerolineae bacterium]